MGIEVLAVGAILGAAGTAYGAYSQYEAGKDAAKLQNQQAAMEREAAGAEAANVREKGKRLIGAQRAALAASGVKIDEGSGDALQQETARLTEQDALAVLKGGANRAGLLNAQAAISKKNANSALVAGGLDVASTAVSGAAAYQKAKAPKTDFNLKAGAQEFTQRNQPKYSLLTGKHSELS